jgi:hypothetical protein
MQYLSDVNDYYHEEKSYDYKELVFCKTYSSAAAFRCEESWVDCVWNVEKNSVVPT